MQDILQKDLQHNWHPCSQMKDYQEFPAIVVKSAQGAYLKLEDGRRLIDAISSWWCKSLGHGHPSVKAALQNQLEQFEHVMFGHTTHEKVVRLSEKLASLSPNLSKVFYACDGSSAVEIALKMSLHARQIRGETQRTRFMGLENAYHGETALAMSVSDLGIYRKPYQAILMDNPVLRDIPYVSGKEDPLWDDCSALWPVIEAQLEPYQDELTAIIIEPIVQGAAGMRVYSQDFLRRLRAWTHQHGIHLIADEIMTGLGRTGLPLACHHAEIEPDFLCLGKGLTAGFLPLSATLTSDRIYEVFYDDYLAGKSFLHSHTHSGNALAVSAALAAMEAMESENIYAQLPYLETNLQSLMAEIVEETGLLTNLRGIGGIVAADIINSAGISRPGFALFKEAVQQGALLRPIGNQLYWLPPLNVSSDVLYDLKDITLQSLRACFDQSGRICGNKITSRMEGLSVNSITKRSIPIPSPAVGGMPYSRAST